MEYEQLIEEALFAALPGGRQPAGPQPRLAELAGEMFVLPSYEAAQGLRRDIDRACLEGGFAPRVAREISPLTAVLLMVAAGAGVNLIPASVAHSYPVPSVEYVQLAEPPTTTAGMAWRVSETSTIVGNFLETTRTVVERARQPDAHAERRTAHRPSSDADH